MKKILLSLAFLISVYSIGYSQCIPSVILYNSPSGSICSHMAVSFTAVAVNGGTPIYKWTSSLRGVLSSTTSTYTSSNLSHGEVISVEMTSSLGCANPTIASASITMSVDPTIVSSVSITSDRTIVCNGQEVTFTATATNGGPTPTYQWSKNAVSIPSATNSTYTTAGSVNGDSYTVQMTNSYACAVPLMATSQSIVITVTPTPTINVTLISNISGMCIGYPAVFTTMVTGSGTTPAPTYEWFITSASTPTAGVSQGSPSTTATTFTTSALTETNNKVYVKVKSNAACASSTQVTSNVVPITINTGIGGGTIASDQTICYNSVPAAITQTAASPGVVGTPIYTWEASTTGISAWFVIPGATNATYTPTVPINQDVYIRRITTDPATPAPCNIAYSNTIHIIVRPPYTVGIIAGDETLCSGAASSTIIESSAPIGGIGTYTYQWQSDASGTFQHIAGATNATYAPGVLTATTHFRRTETIGGCGIGTSNVVTKTITAAEVVTAVIDNTPTQVCAGMAITFTAAGSSYTGTGLINYQWFVGTTPVGVNSLTYNYTSIIGDNGKTVKVVVTTSTGCNAGPATSTPFILDIVSSITPTVSVSGNPVNCIGLPTTFTATSTGGGSTPTYQWYIVPSSSPFGTTGTPVGSNSTTFTSTSLTNGDRVYVQLTSNLNCIVGINPYKSNEIIMMIKPLTSPVINEGDQTICTPNVFTYTANVYAGSVYQWLFNNNPIIGATNNTYTATQSGTYSIREDNGTCSAISAAVNLTVDPCGGFSTSISGPNPITSGQQNAVYSVVNQTGFTYTWSVTGGTIVSGQNTNSVTVDWDAPTSSAFARTTATSYSISVLEKNQSNQTKTTTLDVHTITTGVTQTQAQSGINVFPNPTAGSFNIEMPESGVEVAYEILDLTGLSVASGTFTSTGSDQTINADFGAGMYQFVLKYNNNITCIRLSKVQ